MAATTADARARKLLRLREAILRHRLRLHDAMWQDFRKPGLEVDLTEIQPTLMELDHARAHLSAWMRPRRVGTPLLLFGARSQLRYQPRGTVLIMGPWNYPVQLLLNPLVAAVAAGNTAIIRPSEKVPRTAGILADIVRDAFDQAEVACLTEPGIDLARTLIQLPFDHIFFTGSARVGREIAAAAAPHLTSLTLELGGKSPLVVDETADIRTAVERGVWGKFLNAGQTCVAPDYALVHESVLPAFVREAVATIARFYGTDEAARRVSPDYPRIIDAAAFQRLANLLEDAVAHGARVEVGGVMDAAERYLAPTLLTNVSRQSGVMREEIFGPILPVLGFSRLDDELATINARGKPLAMYLFTRSRQRADAVLRGTVSGGVVVNDVVVHLANPHLPFGGVGESGQGSYHGWFGFRTFSHERSVMYQGRVGAVRWLHPPYDARSRRLLRLVSRLTI